MKRILIVATVVSLLVPGMAAAQTDQQQPPPQGNRPGGPPGQPNRPPSGRPQPQPGRPAPQPGRPAPQPGRPMPQPGRPMPGRPMPGRPGFQRPPTYVQPLPPRGNQFWHRGQYYGRIPGPAFAYPPGWRYRQWLIGQRVPPLFLAPNYYFQNWASLGLQAPAPGYVWVRFGPDLLLINQNTNEVEDVVYGAFM